MSAAEAPRRAGGPAGAGGAPAGVVTGVLAGQVRYGRA
jgi:hypothetical protein